MVNPTSKATPQWTAAQREAARRTVDNWRLAGPELEAIKQRELREEDQDRALELLCCDHDYTIEPRLPRPTSGLVEQQRLFMKALGRE